MPPTTQLEKIAELSPILHAALKAVLHGVPFGAQRVFGCCAMDTDHLVDALETAIYRVKHKTDGSSSINQVLELLRHVHGVRVEELLLGKSIAIKPENCQRMLTLWFEAEVLFSQVDPWLEKYVSINKSFSMALSSHDVKSLAGLIECLKEFNARDTALVICLQSYEELLGKIKTTKEQLEMLDGAVGKIAALTLLDLAREKIEKAVSAMNLTVAVRDLQTQREVILRLIAADSEYREEFSGYPRRSVQMGGGILELMRQRVTDLLSVLTERGVNIWSQCASYVQEVNANITVNFAGIPEQVKILIATLDEQQRLLSGLITTNPSGLKVKSGFFVKREFELDGVIVQVTDFLRTNLRVPIASPAVVEASVPRVEASAGEIAATILEQMIVAATAVNHSASAAMPAVAAVSADSVSPEKVVVHVAGSPAPAAVSAGFFPAPSASLSAEQEDRIDTFLAKLVELASQNGKTFTPEQLDRVRKYLTDLVVRGVTNANMTVFTIIHMLEVKIKWLDDTGIKEELVKLLNPNGRAPSL